MPAKGSIAVPGDKSITHRALMLAALTDGRCRLSGALVAGDTRATAACLRALGVKVSPLTTGEVVVQGGGLRPFRRPAKTLQCANSGTTARLLMGLLSAHRFRATLTGDASLRRRPMARIADPLRVMGATITLKDGHLPATVTGGPLKPLDYSSVASAQVKTAILFAGLAGGVRVSVTEPVRSRDHTERLLAMLGATCMSSGVFVALAPPHSLPSFAGRVPGDISSAAYLVASRILGKEGALAIAGVGVNPTRTGFLHAVRRMGAKVREESRSESLGEPVATLVAQPARRLRAIEIEPDEVPSLVDEIVMLACLAARAEGTSVFRGVGELRVKESDRLALVAKNLASLGVKAHSEDETLWVEGTDEPPRGRVVTAGDHRIAMSFAVLGTVKGAKIAIDNRRCVAVSYPTFFRDLKKALRA